MSGCQHETINFSLGCRGDGASGEVQPLLLTGPVAHPVELLDTPALFSFCALSSQ